jgi:tetratricopeptide (TPR) repeat protein
MAGHPLRRGSFVGRAEAVDSLRRQLDEVRAGSPAVTVLVGAPGVGKSTLISELTSDIRARGTRVLVGHAVAVDDPPPYSLLSSAISSASADPLLRSDREPRLGTDPIMLGFAPGLSEGSYPPPKGVEARLFEALGGSSAANVLTRDQALSEVTERLLEYSGHGPTVLILEDVYRGDSSSLTAVELFVKELRERPLWILATTRPLSSLSSVGRMRLERFERSTESKEVELRPFTSAETAEFLRQSEPFREIAAEEVARRFSETGGNPLLLQMLHRRTGPPEVEEATATSPPTLDLAEREILELSAVLGPEFPFSLLVSAAGGQSEERLAETLDHLVGLGLLIERPGETVEFPDERRREETYDALPERRRRLLHLRAGTALEGLDRPDPPRIYALARHFYRAGELAKSIRYNRLAAELAERALAPDVAWDYLSHALESQRAASPNAFDTEAELVLGLARLTEEVGDLRDAQVILDEFFDRVKDAPGLSAVHRATLEILLARVHTDRGNLPQAEELARKVLETRGLENQDLVLLGAHHQLGQVFYYLGRYPEALAEHDEEIRLARRVRDARILGRAQAWRIAALAMVGQAGQAISEARELTAARDRLGSPRESAQAHLYLGDILADVRSPPSDRRDAVREYAEAIRFARLAKDPRRVGWALYKTSELLLEARQFTEASEKAEQSCLVLDQIGDEIGRAMAIKVRGQIASALGDLQLAKGFLDEARSLLQGTSHRLEELDVVLRLAQLLQKLEDLDGARDLTKELDAMGLRGARPDLVGEFEELQRALASRQEPGGQGDP